MGVNVVQLTKSYPMLSLFVRRVRAGASGRPYFFNRQRMRLRVFREIDRRISFENYIETGTYLGLTTHFLAVTACNRGSVVHSCEVNDEYFAAASRIVGDMENVRLHHANSDVFLKRRISFISTPTGMSTFRCGTS
jgi:predicted O-methyltransferase YrrM